MRVIHANMKVTREELDATNGYTVGEQYTPFLKKLIKEVEEKANGEECNWYLYDRFPNGPEGDILLYLSNKELSKEAKVHLQCSLVARFTSDWKYINPIIATTDI